MVSASDYDKSDDYIGSWESFLPNMIAQQHNTGARFMVIDMSVLQKRWPSANYFTRALKLMFNTAGFTVLTNLQLMNVDAIIDIGDIRHVFTTAYALCKFGNVNDGGVIDDVESKHINEWQARKSTGRALRNALYQTASSVYSYGATISDIQTAKHVGCDITCYGLGLDDPYGLHSYWDGRLLDGSYYPDYWEDLAHCNHGFKVVTSSIKSSLAELSSGDQFIMKISDPGAVVDVPPASQVYTMPYGKGVIVFGVKTRDSIQYSIDRNSLKAWVKQPMVVHNAQAKAITEKVIHRISTQAACLLNNRLDDALKVDLSNGVIIDDLPRYAKIDKIEDHVPGEVSLLNGELHILNAELVRGVIAIDSDSIRFNLNHPDYKGSLSEEDITGVLTLLSANIQSAQKFNIPVYTMFRQIAEPGVYITVQGSGSTIFANAMNAQGELRVDARSDRMEATVMKELAAEQRGELTLESIPWNLYPGIHVCLFSISNAPMNRPMQQQGMDTVARLDLVTYPDFYAVQKARTDLIPLPSTADPALRVFGKHVNVQHSLVDSIVTG
jgi:hypothetical protein